MVVRVGIAGRDLSGSPISGLLHDAQVDRSENEEVALIAQARFGWSDASGAWWLWAALGVPTLLTGVFALNSRMIFPNNLVYIPDLWSRKDGSLLSLSECLSGGKQMIKTGEYRGESVQRLSAPSFIIRSAFDEVLTFPRSRTAERVESDEVRVLRERLAKVFLRANQPPNVGMASQFLIDHAHLIDD
jgi:hypothetical protein